MIVLVGFMGAGKTTVGRILAAKLGLPFRDTDAMVVAEAAMSISEIFEKKGEPGFRELEREAVYTALEAEDAVVALGGGALGDPGIVGRLQKAPVAHLDVGYGEAMRRIGGDEGRPMLERNPRELFRHREEMYRTVADFSIETNGRDPEDIAIELARRFGLRDDAFDRVQVSLGERSYDVIIGTDAVSHFAESLPEFPGAEKAFLITHPSLHEYAAPLLSQLGTAGLEPIVLFTPEGERSKSSEIALELYGKLADNEAHRRDVVVTFGGGAVTDVGGFVASTYARGMPLVHVPTTLLAQVDAAIGGKTGINLPTGKNLVGTIYQPAQVVADVSLLATCPPEEIRAGLAEVIKYGFIADPPLLDSVVADMEALLAADPGKLTSVVSRCAAIKAEIVSMDERETGLRAILNYGHTFGHAIERVREFSAIRHGEAVALGMMAAAYLAYELELIAADVVQRHRDVVTAAGLPVADTFDLVELEEAWQLDKKFNKGVRFVLLKGVGKPQVGIEASRSALVRVLERLRS